MLATYVKALPIYEKTLRTCVKMQQTYVKTLSFCVKEKSPRASEKFVRQKQYRQRSTST